MLHKRSLVLSLATTGVVWGWTTTTTTTRFSKKPVVWSPSLTTHPTARFMAPTDGDLGDDDKIERTSFDQAGASLIEEEDQKRMEQMGDFDSNDSVGLCCFVGLAGINSS